MKKTVVFPIVMSLLLRFSGMVSAQTVKLVSGGYEGASFVVSTPTVLPVVKEVGNEAFVKLEIEGGTHLFRLGEPDLPVVSQLIEVPLCEDVRVEVSDVETRSFSLASMEEERVTPRLMPMQPLPSKSDVGPQPFVMDSALYATDAFYAAPELAWVERIGVARDRNLAVLRVSPLRYNPVTGEVVQVTSLKVTVTYEGADEQATRELHRRYYSPAFTVGSDILSTLPADKGVNESAPLHYLIVAHSSFRGALDDLVAWKRRRGMLVTIAYTDDPGVGTTSAEIAQYVKSFYTNASDELPAPTYLLIVGDHNQIPAFDARCTSPDNDHITDLYYVTWDGDNVPDCYRGRFSARTLAELTPQVEKTLLYEGYNFADPSYLGRGVLIAGEDQGQQSDNAYRYADPTMDYVAKTYMTADNGYTDVRYYKNNTSFAPTGVTVTGSCNGSSVAATLRSIYNQGCGWVNYSAHGSATSWSTPQFTTSQVAQMSNNGKPGVFIGNCCLSGHFQTDNCMGESLLRKGNNAGAVAYIGATNSTYWPHDFCWSVGFRSNISGTMNTSYNASNRGMYDRLFHTHNEPYTQWSNTLGSMITAGNMAVEAYGSYQLYYWEIYQLFGDPSLIPWLGLPDDMPCNAPAVFARGGTVLSFVTAPRAYVALTTSEGHELVTAAYANQSTGEVILNLPPTLAPGNYELAIWAQGYKPLFRPLTVTVPAGPYLTAVEMHPQGKLVPGGVQQFDIRVANVGVSASGAATLTLEPVNEGAASLLPPVAIPSVAAGDTVTITSAATLYVSSTSTDGTELEVAVVLDFDNSTVRDRFKLPVVAPKLKVSGVVASAIASGTTATVDLTVTNEGHDSTSDLTFSLVDKYALTATAATPVHAGVLLPGQSVQLSFTMTMEEALPQGMLPFDLTATSDDDSYVLEELSFRGEGLAVEDFESGDFSCYNWLLGNNNKWIVTNSLQHNGSYCARSKNNLGNRATSTLTIQWTSQNNDSLSFWYKVSSEENYDWFTFSVDNVEKLNVSGIMTDWERASFPVAAGTHTYKFSYSKDMSSTGGSDCVWIDDITFPFNGNPCTFLSDTVCRNAEYQHDGTTLSTDQLGTTAHVDTAADGTVHWLALTVTEAPQVSITTSGSLLAGGKVLLTAHGANRYLWSTGETTATIAVGPSESTVYTVMGFLGTCSSEASLNVTVGIGDSPLISQVPSITVYPTPTDGLLVVEGSGMRRLTVVSLMGRTHMQMAVTGDRQVLDLRTLADGVYLLRVETEEGVTVRKVVKRSR